MIQMWWFWVPRLLDPRSVSPQSQILGTAAIGSTENMIDNAEQRKHRVEARRLDYKRAPTDAT